MPGSSKACYYPSDISDTPRKMSASLLGAMRTSVYLRVVCLVVGATPGDGWGGVDPSDM